MPIEDYVGGLPSWYGANRAPAVSQSRTPTTPNLPVAAIPTPASPGALAGLTQQLNDIMLAGTKAAQGARIPGGPALEQKSSDVIGQELAGGVPDDVIKLLQQQSGEGTFGSGVNPMAAYERLLGVTSMGQVQTGEQNLSAATARNPAASTFDPSTQLLTPGQAGNLALGQQSQNLAAQAEADRVALEQQRLALEAGTRTASSGGYGGQVGGPVIPGPSVNYGGDVASFSATPGYGFTFPSGASLPIAPNDQAYYDAVLGVPDYSATQAALRPEDTGLAAVSGSPEEGV